MMKKLDLDFYRREDVVKIARELIGKVLISTIDGVKTSGRIVETEAYAGEIDRASHAYAGRRTKRNEVMYQNGGLAYVYLCYGIHHLFNVVTNLYDRPHAVLIRALEPMEGIHIMLARTGKLKPDNSLTRGPGNLSKALGIYSTDTGTSLTGRRIYLADDGFVFAEKTIASSPRIGVDYAGQDALLPYRFYVRGNSYVSGKPK